MLRDEILGKLKGGSSEKYLGFVVDEIEMEGILSGF